MERRGRVMAEPVRHGEDQVCRPRTQDRLCDPAVQRGPMVGFGIDTWTHSHPRPCAHEATDLLRAQPGRVGLTSRNEAVLAGKLTV